MVVIDDFWLDLPGSAEAWSQCLQAWGGGPYRGRGGCFGSHHFTQKDSLLTCPGTKVQGQNAGLLVSCFCIWWRGLEVGVGEAREGAQ